MGIQKPFKYSALMSVYYKEKPQYLKESIDCVVNQTVLCDEFVIVEDGPLTKELNEIIEEYQRRYPKLFNIVKIKNNGGLGPALKVGVERCSNEWIARFDSDDISVNDRCEKQLKRIMENPKIDIIGSNHIEFIDDINNKKSYSYKVLPSTNEKIISYAKRRNPFSHSAILMRKSIVLKVGNYRKYHLVEDYDLWVRMIECGAYCENINDFLNYVRVSDDLYKRRGGFKYLMSILKFKKELYNKKFYSLRDFVISSVAHIVMCLVPYQIRNLMYKKILRK